MLKLVICGSPLHPSSHHQDQDQNHHQDQVPMSQLSRSAGTSPCCTPKKSRKTSFSRSHNNKEKNPYATRGLEKFSALLVDLEEKRQKIYEQSAAAEDISFVRFVYKNSNDLVPIIVKLKDSSQKEAENITNNNKTTTTHTAAAANEDLLLVKDQQQSIQNYSSEITHDDKFPMMKEVKNKSQRSEQSSRKVTKKLLLQSWRSMVNLDKLRRPSYYLPVVVIVILILLVFFGRSIAILCTSIGWYVVPTLNDSSSNRKRSSVVHKKDYVKKLSERKMMTEGVSSPRIYNKSGHQRSW
ncbi:hypothetical protein F8388_003356 [Cannabis sativa]|uniref:ZCF37 n=1 Tax=Cannabis sativa TaxID=3483 RepID=A0A7J6FDC6_CANSA|nr:hypothetical protein F8388_003356 [Cannabis sativa]